MRIVRRSAEELREHARVKRAIFDKTAELKIAAQAKSDGNARTLERALAEGKVRIVRPIDVAAIRAKTGLSQALFARAFRISPHTLRNWEQGRRTPEGPARALLTAIDRDPEALMRALGI
jgi:putative transcriptional regulator